MARHKKTRGQKFAENKGSEYMAKIGARGGKKSAGSYGRIPGLARRAGKRGAIKKHLNYLQAKIDANTATDADRAKKQQLQAEYDGTAAIDMGGGVAQSFETLAGEK